MKKLSAIVMFAALFVIAAAAVSFADGNMRRYANARFGFAVEVPSSLKAMPEPANGDGREFRDQASGLKITVSGSYNVIPQGPADELLMVANGARAQFLRKTPREAAGTWSSGSRYSWYRVIMVGPEDDSHFISVLISYPKSYASRGEAVAHSVMASLRSVE